MHINNWYTVKYKEKQKYNRNNYAFLSTDYHKSVSNDNDFSGIKLNINSILVFGKQMIIILYF